MFQQKAFEIKKLEIKELNIGGYRFTLFKEHPLISRGIFNCFGENEEIPFDPHTFAQLAYYEHALDENLLNLIKIIIPLSIEVIEKNFIKRLMKNFEPNLKQYVKRNKINIVPIIEDERCETLENFKDLLRNKMERDYREHTKIVHNICNDQDFEKLYDYECFTGYILQYLQNHPFDKSKTQDLNPFNFNLMKHIIDNIVDWNENDVLNKCAVSKIKPIHYILKYSSPKVIEYAKNQGIQFTQQDIDQNPVRFDSCFRLSTMKMNHNIPNSFFEKRFKPTELDILCGNKEIPDSFDKLNNSLPLPDHKRITQGRKASESKYVVRGVKYAVIHSSP